MKLKLLHLYGDLLNLYGEYANIEILARSLRSLGHEVAADTLSLGEEKDISDYDFYYVGAGTEQRLKQAIPALLKYKEALCKAMDDGKVLLFTGNACDLLGASLTDSEGKTYPCLGFGSFESIEGKRRITGDCVGTMEGVAGDLVGFINKCSVSKNVEQPLISLRMGFGNETSCGSDGFRVKNCIGTHVTGPILVKNPKFLSYVLGLLLGEDAPEVKNEYAEKAYEITHRALLARMEQK